MVKKSKGYFKVERGFFDLRLRPHTAMVYLYLLSSINKDTRQCWPSMKTIARKLDISKSTVEKAIVELAQKHLIIKSNRSRDSLDIARDFGYGKPLRCITSIFKALMMRKGNRLWRNQLRIR